MRMTNSLSKAILRSAKRGMLKQFSKYLGTHRMPNNQIRIIVEGDSKDKGHVRLNDFLQQLEAVKSALKQTERILAPNEKGAAYYRIVDVSHNSPLTVVLEATSEQT